MPKHKHAPLEIIARAVLFRDSSVLLCQAPGGYYYLPGGHVEFGEPAAAALAREFVEECGLRVLARDLILVAESTFRTGSKDHHELNLVFHVEHHSGPPPAKVVPREPDITFRWHPAAALRELDVRPVPVRDWLTTWDPERPRTGAAWLSSISAPR